MGHFDLLYKFKVFWGFIIVCSFILLNSRVNFESFLLHFTEVAGIVWSLNGENLIFTEAFLWCRGPELHEILQVGLLQGDLIVPDVPITLQLHQLSQFKDNYCFF